jgi:hypothetical protein
MRTDAFSFPKMRSNSSDAASAIFRLIEEAAGRCQVNAQSYNSRDFIERTEMRPCRAQRIHARGTKRVAPGLDVDLLAKAPYALGLAIHHRQHAAEKEQSTGLYRLHVGAERLRWCRQLDSTNPQSLFSIA